MGDDWRSTMTLPVRIIDFSGVVGDGITNLTWKVENEGDLKHYQLQRSTDGVNFNTVVAINPGNTASSFYSYVDKIDTIISKAVYYRVKQVNKDGNEFLTNILKFGLERLSNYQPTVYPTPSKNVVNIVMKSAVKDEASVTIFDGYGKAVLARKVKLEIGQNNITIAELANFPAGVYLIVVRKNDETWSRKVLKQ